MSLALEILEGGDKGFLKHVRKPRSRIIREKTNSVFFMDIEIGKDNKFYKRQKGHVCPSCFHKRSVVSGVVCDICKKSEGKAVIVKALENNEC